MMTSNSNVNDANFQTMDLNFIFRMETAYKLIIEASAINDELQYVGEILANPYIDFEDVKEFLTQKMFKIITRTEEKLKIKIGPIPLEMFPKPKTQVNKLRKLQNHLRNSLKKSAELQKIINTQKEQIARLMSFLGQQKSVAQEIKSNKNVSQAPVQSESGDLKRQTEQIINVKANYEKKNQSKPLLIYSPIKSQSLQSQSQYNNSSQQPKECMKDFKKKQERSIEYSLSISNEKEVPSKQKLFQKLYRHIEQTISKQKEYYAQKSQKYYNKALSKSQVEEETIKFMNFLKQNIKPLPPQHEEQLFFLIDLFNSKKICIINHYRISSNYKNSTSEAKFYLSFAGIKQRIHLKKFLSFNNWNHLLALSFQGCGWFNNDDWRKLVEHADNFNNLKILDLRNNKITEIKEGDFLQFPSLQMIGLRDNPVNAQSKQMLQNIKQKNKKMQILY